MAKNQKTRSQTFEFSSDSIFTQRTPKFGAMSNWYRPARKLSFLHNTEKPTEFPVDYRILREFIAIAEEVQATNVRFLYPQENIHRSSIFYVYINAFINPEKLINNQPLDGQSPPFFCSNFKAVFHFADMMVTWSRNTTKKTSDGITFMETTEEDKKRIGHIKDLSWLSDVENDNSYIDGTVFEFAVKFSMTKTVSTWIKKLQEENVGLILFLLSVEHVNFYFYKNENTYSELDVSITADSLKNVQKNRRKIKDMFLFRGLNQEETNFIFEFSIDIKSYNSRHESFIVLFLIGKTAVNSNWRPFVGVCVRLSNFEKIFENIPPIYCFSSITNESVENKGFPVFLHANFEMDNSKNIVQTNTKSDENLNINSSLINTWLPRAYVDLIMHIIRNNVLYHQNIYSLFPKNSVRGKWKGMVDTILTKMLNEKEVVYAENKSGSFWVNVNKTYLFDISKNHSLANIVAKIAKYSNEMISLVPSCLITQLEVFSLLKLQFLTPPIMRKILKSCALDCLKSEEKIKILEFILSDNKFWELDGIQLLPLQDGSFIEFSSNTGAERIYMTVDKGSSFTNEGSLVLQSLPPKILYLLRNVNISKCTQLSVVDQSYAVHVARQQNSKPFFKNNPLFSYSVDQTLSISNHSVNLQDLVDPNDILLKELFSRVWVTGDDDLVFNSGNQITRENFTASHAKRIISSLVDNSNDLEFIDKKISNLLRIFEEKKEILSQRVDKEELQNYLIRTRWLIQENSRPSKYPLFLPWYGTKSHEITFYSPRELHQNKYWFLIGSQVGVHKFEFSDYLTSIFEIERFPRATQIEKHYECIIRYQNMDDLPHFNEYMRLYYSTFIHFLKEKKSNELFYLFPVNLLWNGSNFVDLKKQCIFNTLFLESITDLKSFFGINCENNIYSYLKSMENKYKKLYMRDEVQTDLDLIFSAIQDVFDRKISLDLLKIRLPKHSIDNRRIFFISVDDCLAVDSSLNNFKYVIHEACPEKLMEQLKTKILKQLHQVSSSDICKTARGIFRFANNLGSLNIKLTYDRRITANFSENPNDFVSSSESLWIYYEPRLSELSDNIFDFLEPFADNITIFTENKICIYNLKKNEIQKIFTSQNSEKLSVYEDHLSSFNLISGCEFNVLNYSGTLIRCPLSKLTSGDCLTEINEKIMKLLFQEISTFGVKFMLYLDKIIQTSIFLLSPNSREREILFNLTKSITILKTSLSSTIYNLKFEGNLTKAWEIFMGGGNIKDLGDWILAVLRKTSFVNEVSRLCIGYTAVPKNHLTSEETMLSCETCLPFLEQESNGFSVFSYAALFETSDKRIQLSPEFMKKYSESHNEMLQMALRDSYLTFLEYLCSNVPNMLSIKKYYSMWPVNRNLSLKYFQIAISMYEKIFFSDRPVFPHPGGYFSIRKVAIFDDSVYKCHFIEDIIKAYQQIIGLLVVRRIPSAVMSFMVENNVFGKFYSHVFDIKRLYSDFIDPNLHRFNSKLQEIIVNYGKSELFYDFKNKLYSTDSSNCGQSSDTAELRETHLEILHESNTIILGGEKPLERSIAMKLYLDSPKDYIFRAGDTFLNGILDEFIAFLDGMNCYSARMIFDLQNNLTKESFSIDLARLSGPSLCFEVDKVISLSEITESSLEDQKYFGLHSALNFFKLAAVYIKDEEFESLEVVGFDGKKNKLLITKYSNLDSVRKLYSQMFEIFESTTSTKPRVTIFHFPVESVLGDVTNLKNSLNQYKESLAESLIFMKYLDSVSFLVNDKNIHKQYEVSLRCPKDSNHHKNGKKDSNKNYSVYQTTVLVKDEDTSEYDWICYSENSPETLYPTVITACNIKNRDGKHFEACVENTQSEKIKSLLKKRRVIVKGNFIKSQGLLPGFDNGVDSSQVTNFVKSYFVIFNSLINSYFELNCDEYWQYFPTNESLDFENENITNKFISGFYKLKLRDGECFPAVRLDSNKLTWTTFENLYFIEENHVMENSEIIKALEKWGLNFCRLPKEISENVKSYLPKSRYFCMENIFGYFLGTDLNYLVSHLTKVECLSTLKIILEYILREGSPEIDLVGTYLLLTEDFVFSLADSKNPKYLFEYNEIFGNSSNMFVNRELLFLYKNQRFSSSGIFRNFEIDDLVNFLVNNKKLMEKLDISPFLDSLEELKVLWNLIDSSFLEFCNIAKIEGKNTIIEIFFKKFRPIQHWRIFPVIGEAEINLLSIVEHSRIFIFPKDVDHDLLDFFAMAKISRLDDICSNFWFIQQIILSIDDGLDCLIKEIRNVIPTPQQMTALYKFAISKIQLINQDEFLCMFSCLRSYRLYDERFTDLRELNPFIYSKDDIPLEDSSKWCLTNNMALLKGDLLSFETLLKVFKIQELNKIEVYELFILPNFPSFSQKARDKHLIFIRDLVDDKLCGDHFVDSLKRARLVPDENQILRKPNDLFDPENAMFCTLSTIFQEIIFPSPTYSTCEWIVFLKRLALSVQLTSKHLHSMVDRAAFLFEQNDFSSEDMHNIASALYNCCAECCTCADEIDRLSSKKFIPAYHHELYSLFEDQITLKQKLICLKGSVLHSAFSICWTVSPILPKWLVETDKTRDFLKKAQVQLEVPVTAVISNLINIAPKLENIPKFDVKLMHTILHDNFCYLSGTVLDARSIETMSTLKIVPTNSNSFVLPEMAFFVLTGLLSIPTVLESVHSDFYDLMNFLFKLGVSKEPNVTTFIRINNYYAEKQSESLLNPNEIICVIQSTKQLFNCLLETPVDKIGELFSKLSSKFYLPCRTGQLLISNKVLYSDNSYLLSRIYGIDSNLFISHYECGIDFDSFIKAILLIPQELRPSALSDVVTEMLDQSCLSTRLNLFDELFSPVIRSRLKNDDFHIGISRLMIATAYDLDYFLCPSEIDHYVNCISSVEIVSLSYIKTYLFYNDELIPDSEYDCDCFYQALSKKNSTPVIYIKNRVSSNKRTFAILVSILNRICNGFLRTKKDLVLHILMCPTYEINNDLDNLHIPDNDGEHIPSSLPILGSEIPSSNYSYLYPNQTDFKINEYVGFIEPNAEFEGPFYALISDCIQNGIFRLRIGPLDSDVVDICLINLLKISRNIENVDHYIPKPKKEKTEESNNSKPKDREEFTFFRQSKMEEKVDLPEDEIRRDNERYERVVYEIKREISKIRDMDPSCRKKQIKKLLLKWHPDKNPKDVPFSNKVFAFIQSEIANCNLFDTSNRNPWEFMGFSSWENFYENIKRKTSFRETEPDINSQESQFPNHKSETKNDEQTIKAQMWLTQAKADLETAASIDYMKTKSYEWMAYIACQAIEKTVKAVYIKLFNNSVDFRSKIKFLSSEINDLKLIYFVEQVENIRFRQIYEMSPDQTHVPHDIATLLNADQAILLAKKILEYAQITFFK